MAYLWPVVDAEGEILDCAGPIETGQACRAVAHAQAGEEIRFHSRLIDHRRPAVVCCRRPRLWNREAPRTRSMAQQPSGELASADPTTGTQDAGLQNPRICLTISLNPCSRLQHLQRPTSSDISVDTPRLPCRFDGQPGAWRSLEDLRHAAFRVPRSTTLQSLANVTMPFRALWRPARPEMLGRRPCPSA